MIKRLLGAFAVASLGIMAVARAADVPDTAPTTANTNGKPLYRPLDIEKDGFRVTCQATQSRVDAYGKIVSANVVDFTAIAYDADPSVSGTKLILLTSGSIVDGKLETTDYGTFEIRSGVWSVMTNDNSIAKIRKALKEAAKAKDGRLAGSPQADLKTALAQLARLFRGVNEMAIDKTYLPPDSWFAHMTAEQQAHETEAPSPDFPFFQAILESYEAKAQMFESLINQTPKLNASGDKATYTAIAPFGTDHDGTSIPVIFVKINGLWYLQTAFPPFNGPDKTPASAK